MAPSVLSVAQARAANLGEGLDDDALEDAIEEEEAWLARRIGPLVGERTEYLPLAYLSPTRSEIRLRRPTDEVEVELDGSDATSAFEVRADGWRVARLPEGERISEGVLRITYTPTDELEVRRALKVLVGLSIADQSSAGMQAEIMGSYSYTRAAGAPARVRRAIVRQLQGPSEAGSVRVLSSHPHDVVGSLGRP